MRNSVVSAVPTHWDPRCGWSCTILNVAAASLLRAEAMTADDLLAVRLDGVRATLPELSGYGYDAKVPDGVRAAVREASTAVIGDLRCDGDDMGYTLLALQFGLIAYWRRATSRTP